MQLINTFGGKEMNVVRLFCLLCVCSVLFGCKSVSHKQSSGEQKAKGDNDTVTRNSNKYPKGIW